MRVACNRCQTKFDVPDERIAGGAVKVRCTECGNTFVVRRRSQAVTAKPEAPATGSPEEPSPAAPLGEAAPGKPEAQFDDFDFGGFGDAGKEAPAPGGAEPVVEDPAVEEPAGSLDDLPPIGELDLGGLDDLDVDLGGIEELDLGSLEDELPGAEPEPVAEEPLEQIREEDLMGAAPGENVPVRGMADDIPRLDMQRGPRRAEGGTPSPVMAGDRRRSPLLWLVVLAAVGTAGFSGYLVYTNRDAGFTFLDPARISALWQRRAMEAKLDAVELQGYYKDLPADRRVFVIQGNIVNRSDHPQSLIKVRGELFGPSGATVASTEVFCGNVLSENELATLPLATIEARLQNEVGEGLRNVDIAPRAKVPFMVVFPTPPEDVAKFNVLVTEAQTGSGS